MTLRTNSQKANKKITDQFLDNNLKTTYFRKMMMKMTLENLLAGQIRFDLEWKKYVLSLRLFSMMTTHHSPMETSCLDFIWFSRNRGIQNYLTNSQPHFSQPRQSLRQQSSKFSSMFPANKKLLFPSSGNFIRAELYANE